MGGIVDDLAVGTQNGTGVGVHTQHPVAAAQVGPDDVVVLVTLGQAVGRRVAEEGIVVPEGGIEDGGLGPVAVEAQEGQAQVHAMLVIQIDEALHIDAVLKVLTDPCLVLGGQGNGDGHIAHAAGGDGDRSLAEGHIAGQGAALLGHELEAAHVHIVLGQQAAVQGVGLVGIGEVVDLEAEGVLAGGTVAQLSLGLVAAHGQVSLGGDGTDGVDQTGTLLTGRGLHAAGGADDGHCGGHQQVLRQLTDAALRGIGELVEEVLHDQGGDTGHLGGSHGGAVHDTVGAVIDGGVHIAADTGDIGSQTQVGSHAPAGEGADLAAHDGGHDALGGGDGHGADLGGDHGLAVGQGDGDGGNIAGDTCGQAAGGGIGHVHGEELAGVDVVVDDHAHGTVGLGVGQLQGEVDGAALDQGHLTGHIEAFVVASLTQAGDHNELQLAQGGQGVKGHIQTTGLGVGHLGIAVGEVGGHAVGVVGGADGGGVGVDGGGVDGCVVGVCGGVLVGAPHVLVGAGVVITAGDGDHDVLGSDALVDQVQLVVGGAEACGGAQGQVGHITAQQHGILQSGDQIVSGTGAGGTEDLHDDDLGIGSHTHHLGALDLGVGGGDTGHVGAVVALVVLAVVTDQVAVGVVEDEGHLLGVVQVLGGDIALHALVGVQVLQHIGDVLHGQGVGVRHGSGGEGGVIQVQTGIQNGDLHAGAGVAQVGPDGGHAHHLTAGGGGGSDGAGQNLSGVVHGHHEDALDTGHGGDLLQVDKLRLDGEGVGQVSKLIADGQLLTLQNVLLDLVDQNILGGDQLLLLPGGDPDDGAVELGQGGLLHDDEGGDHLVGGDDLSGPAQLFDAGGGVGQGQGSGSVLQGSGVPLALRFAGVFCFLLGQRVVPQIQGTGGCLLCGSRSGRCGVLGLHGAALGPVRGVGRGSQGGHDHAQHQKQRQQSFASHYSCLLDVFLPGPDGSRPE